MKFVLLRFDRVQPSSTRFRCTFDVLDKLDEVPRICTFSSNNSLYCHSIDIVDKQEYVKLMSLLLSGKLRLVSLGESHLFWLGFHDTPAEYFDYYLADYLNNFDIGVHVPVMIIINVGRCHIGCPWCYAKNKQIVDVYGRTFFELPDLEDLVEKIKHIIYRVCEKFITQFRERLWSIDVTITFGGNGEPTLIDPYYFKEFIIEFKKSEHQLYNEVSEKFSNIINEAFSISTIISLTTSDPFRLVNYFSTVLSYFNHISITYIPEKLRKYLRIRYDTRDFGNVINQIYERSDESSIDLQFILTKNISRELEYVFDEIVTKILIGWLYVYPLHYYDVDFREESIFLTRKEEIVHELINIMRVYPVDRIEAGLIKLDVCTIKKLLGIDMCSQVLKNGLMWRLTHTHTWEVECVNTCPMGNICKISELSF